MRSPFRCLALRSLALLLVTTACAGLQTVPLQPLSTDLSTFSSAVVSVTTSTAEDVKREQTMFGALVVGRLTDLRQFRTVTAGDSATAPAGALLVKVAISGIRRVGAAQRFMLGVFAGRAQLTVNAEFIETSGNRSLGAYTVKGQSGGTGLSGGTDDALEQAAKAVADLVAKNITRRAEGQAGR